MSIDRADNDPGVDPIVRRFVAENSRMALRQVRERLGGDAVILANRSIAGGVEVLAAAPGAIEALTRRAPGTTAAAPTELGLAVPPASQRQPTPVSPLRNRIASLFSRRWHAQPPVRAFIEQAGPALRTPAAMASRSYADFAGQLAANPDDDASGLAPGSVTLSRSTAGAAPAAVRDAIDEVRRVAREMHAMQAQLGEQLSTLSMSTDAMRLQPAGTTLMQDLILAGFSPALARDVGERLPGAWTHEEARAWAEAVLRRNLPVAGDADAPSGAGGVFSLVGSTVPAGTRAPHGAHARHAPTVPPIDDPGAAPVFVPVPYSPSPFDDEVSHAAAVA